MTADGRLVSASRFENVDLFWALHGAGRGLGVVTSLTLSLRQLGPTVPGGVLLYPFEDAARVLTRYQALMRRAPAALCGAAAVLTAPPEVFVPAALQGRAAIAVFALWAGEDELEAQWWLQELRELSPSGPALDLVVPAPYCALQRMLDELRPAPLRRVVRSRPIFEVGGARDRRARRPGRRRAVTAGDDHAAAARRRVRAPARLHRARAPRGAVGLRGVGLLGGPCTGRAPRPLDAPGPPRARGRHPRDAAPGARAAARPHPPAVGSRGRAATRLTLARGSHAATISVTLTEILRTRP